MADCVICMEKIQSNDRAKLPCGHEYHTTCLMKNVVKSNNTCPLCRVVYTEKPEIIPDLNSTMIHYFVHKEINTYINSGNEEVLINILGECNVSWDSLSYSRRFNIYNHLVNLLIQNGENIGNYISEWLKDGEQRLNLMERDNIDFYPDLHRYLRDRNSNENNEEEEEEFDGIDNVEDLLRKYDMLLYSQRILNDTYLSDLDNLLSADIETLMFPPLRQNTNPLFSREESNLIMGGILRYFSHALEF